MSQAFELISGRAMEEILSRPQNRLASLLASGRSDAEIVGELFWSALSRPPRPAELAAATAHLAAASGASGRRAALEDITWSIVNAKEFIFRR